MSFVFLFGSRAVRRTVRCWSLDAVEKRTADAESVRCADCGLSGARRFELYGPVKLKDEVYESRISYRSQSKRAHTDAARTGVSCDSVRKVR